MPSHYSLLCALCRNLSCRNFCCRSALLYLDYRLIFACLFLTFAKANCGNTEYYDQSDQRPRCFLQKVSRLGSTHYLVSTGKSGCQTAALTVLYQYQKRKQNRGNYNQNSNKYVHMFIKFSFINRPHRVQIGCKGTIKFANTQIFLNFYCIYQKKVVPLRTFSGLSGFDSR